MKSLLLFVLLIMITSQIFAQKSQDTIYWRPDYKLRWSDFKGTQENDRWEAASSCQFSCSYHFNESHIYFTSHCYFLTKKSWIDSIICSNNTLSHEQGHFDICEIYSLKLLNKLNESNIEIYDIKKTVSYLYDYITSQYLEFDQLYDNETLHGSNILMQKEWNIKIQELLKDIQMAK